MSMLAGSMTLRRTNTWKRASYLNKNSRDYCTLNVDQSSWLAICLRHDSNRHIGNIKIGPIHRFHRRADLVYL